VRRPNRQEFAEAQRLFDVACGLQSTALHALRVIHAYGTPAEIEQARANVVSASEAIADRLIYMMDLTLLDKGICPATRARS